jgi:hypothetical protein
MVMKRKLQVFVSSTYSDLIEERQAAVAGILKAGHIPAGMELFTAGDKSQMKTIEQWIDESDVYMLILGGRYGSVEPTTNMSYTEVEYDYAIGRRKALFAVVITEAALEQKVRLNGTHFLEKDHPRELKRFREKVLRNISSFFSDPKDIKLCVHESLSTFATDPKLQGWVSGENSHLLRGQIDALRMENATLIQSLRAEREGRPDRLFQRKEYMRIMEAIQIWVPAEFNGGIEQQQTLLSIAYDHRKSLAIGVTNSASSDALEIFLYEDIIPRLRLHGLADTEGVPGAMYRRGFANNGCMDILAELERAEMFSRGH